MPPIALTSPLPRGIMKAVMHYDPENEGKNRKFHP